MKNLFLLASVLFRSSGLLSLGSDSSNRKKRNQLGSVLLFFFVGIYMAGMMVTSSLVLYDLLLPASLQSLIVSMYLSAGTLLVFFFGMLYVISIFYYAGDVERLLPLPLKAGQIIGAKLMVTAAWIYLYLILLILPPLLVYGVREQLGVSFYLMLGLVMILLPVVPLSLASVLVLLLLRFTPLARNKDRFNLISGLLAMLIALAFVFGAQSMASFNETDLADVIRSGSEAISRLSAAAFPGTGLSVAILTSEHLADQFIKTGLLVLICLAALVITLFAAHLLYFPGVVGMSGSGGQRSRLSSEQLQKAGYVGSAFWSYWRKDLRVLVRTPIFFMNNVMVNFLWPVFFILPFLSGSSSTSMSELLALTRQRLTDPSGNGVSIAAAAYFALVCFISGSNGIASSALSREGRVFYIMKMVPVSWKKQIFAKIGVGVFFSLCGAVLPLLLVLPLLRPPLDLTLLLIAILPGAVLLPNIGGVFFELYWPKLNWDNEQKAVKQNLNVLYGLFLSLLTAAMFGTPVFLFSFTKLQTWLLLGPGSVLLALGAARLLVSMLPKRMHALEP